MSTVLCLKPHAILSTFSRSILSGERSERSNLILEYSTLVTIWDAEKPANDFVSIDPNQARGLAKFTSSQAALELRGKSLFRDDAANGNNSHQEDSAPCNGVLGLQNHRFMYH